MKTLDLYLSFSKVYRAILRVGQYPLALAGGVLGAMAIVLYHNTPQGAILWHQTSVVCASLCIGIVFITIFAAAKPGVNTLLFTTAFVTAFGCFMSARRSDFSSDQSAYDTLSGIKLRCEMYSLASDLERELKSPESHVVISEDMGTISFSATSPVNLIGANGAASATGTSNRRLGSVSSWERGLFEEMLAKRGYRLAHGIQSGSYALVQ